MNINRREFNQYIADSDFRMLFIREMLWNNPQGQTTFDILVEESTYRFEQIAQRSGFQVLTCQVQEIPTSSMAKKIDTRLRARQRIAQSIDKQNIGTLHVPQVPIGHIAFRPVFADNLEDGRVWCVAPHMKQRGSRI